MRILKSSVDLPRKPATALDIMTPNPKSVSEDSTVREIAQAMQKHGIHSAPVIDAAGRPKGVVTRTDVIGYWSDQRRNGSATTGEPDVFRRRHQLPGDELTVRDIMTPVVFQVQQGDSIATVIEKMLALEVRHVFVTDEHGVLIGTVSIFDALRHLARDSAEHAPQALLEDRCPVDTSWELPTASRI